MSFEKPVVVIDNGSHVIKAGFACDNHPVSLFRAAVGRPKYLGGTYGREYYDVYIGDTAMSRIEDLEISSPIVAGRIVHWENMERIWHHCFYRELKVAPEDRAVILALNLLTPMEEKIKCCEVFFETLNAPAICIQSQNALSIYGSGLTSGLSVDLGFDTTDIVPVYEGSTISYAHVQTNLAGKQVNDHLKRSLDSRGIQVGIPDIENIKKLLYLTNNTAMLRKKNKRMYRLPSGEQIDVGQEAFAVAELLFQPDLVSGKKTAYKPLQGAIFQSTVKCDADIRALSYEAVVPSGGLATIHGLNERLALELGKQHGPVNVLASKEASTVVWLGGATFASMAGTTPLWVTKKQFEDHGAKIVRNKFM